MYDNYTDKHKVKKLVSRVIATAHEYAYFETPEQIDAFKWETLPNAFVIKSVSQKGFFIIKKERDRINIPETISKIKTWLTDGGVLIERFIGHNLKEYNLHYNEGVFTSIESEGNFDPKPTNLQQIIDKGNQLVKLVGSPVNVTITICNRELKTCCRTINDLFFGKYDFNDKVN